MNTDEYTLTIDSYGLATPNNFISVLDTPLKKVVEVEVLECSITAPAATSNVFYVCINELSSIFNQLVVPPGIATPNNKQAILSYARNSSNGFFTKNSTFDSVLLYPESIKTLDKFTLSIYSETGQLFQGILNTMLTLRVTCSPVIRVIDPDWIVTIDSMALQTPTTGFTALMDIPLRDIVQAEIMYVYSTVKPFYICIDELQSTFDQALMSANGPSQRSVFSYVGEYSENGNWKTSVQYLYPIKTLDKFTLSFFDSAGAPKPVQFLFMKIRLKKMCY